MGYKTDRTAAEIKKCVSAILQNKLHDPDVPLMTTITDVTVSKDLKYATLYVSVFGGEGEKAINALNSAAGFIRRSLAAELRNMRTIPSLRFVLDNSAEYGNKIDAILKEIADNEPHS